MNEQHAIVARQVRAEPRVVHPDMDALIARAAALLDGAATDAQKSRTPLSTSPSRTRDSGTCDHASGPDPDRQSDMRGSATAENPSPAAVEAGSPYTHYPTDVKTADIVDALEGSAKRADAMASLLRRFVKNGMAGRLLIAEAEELLTAVALGLNTPTRVACEWPCGNGCGATITEQTSHWGWCAECFSHSGLRPVEVVRGDSID